MTYSVRFSKSADRELMRLDRQNRAQIMSWIKKKLLESEDPRRFGHALTADLSGYWSYRVGDYRLVCEIHDAVLVIVVVEVGHRRDIYKNRREHPLT